MNINFSVQNCLTRYNTERIEGETGPDGQNIFGPTDVLINDKYFFVNANTCMFKTIKKDTRSSYNTLNVW